MTRLRIAACILARNEAHTIPVLMGQMARQTLLGRDDVDIVVHVVANGCTDDTAARASAAAPVFAGTNGNVTVHDLPQGGKSRSWNKAVHELVGSDTDYFLFLDADISLADRFVLDELVDALVDQPLASACSGRPVKDISTKSKKSLLDRFSLTISRQSRHEGAINGSLYVARASALQDIWLPDQTPGEDGFLNAMLSTGGFTHPFDPSLILMMGRPSHFYRAHNARNFLSHERRMIVATVINRWIFEHLWSLELKEPAGRQIRRWNEQVPGWVDALVATKMGESGWVIPNAILFGRLMPKANQQWWRRPIDLLSGLVATILTVPPAMAANHRLKRRGAGTTW